jgi:uncharacterized damage-inducible protein DinB
MIVDLFRHNAWANRKLLEACEGLSDEQLNSNIPGVYGTIRDTLGHIIRGEVSYVRRVNGRTPGEPPKEGELPSFEMLKQTAQWTSEELLQLALNAGKTDLVIETWEGTTAQYTVTSLLTQAINHATEHRAQIATVLTQQGIEPPDMSGWAYMEAMGIFEETKEELNSAG